MAAQKEAKVVWQGSELEFQAQMGTGYQFTMHAPADEKGATPMEFLLAGVAGCTAMDVLTILQKKRQHVTGLTVDIQGTQAESPPNVYTQATIKYIVSGVDVDPAAVERAIELSQTKYCSASVTLERSGVAFSTSYEIVEPEPALASA